MDKTDVVDKIYVETDRVKEVAKSIGKYNKTIQDGFDAVNKSMNNLLNKKKKKKKEKAFARYKVIKKVYQDDQTSSRYQVIDNYRKLLEEVVAPDYEKTETTNVKIAEAYK